MLETAEQLLQRATPESQGIASGAILQFVEAVEREIQEFHSFMLLRHGKVVAEAWWSPYERALPHMLFSLSKSFTSTAVGLAVAEGHFSIDDKVLSFFPDETPAEVSDNLAAMRVRDLLSMSSGHVEDTMPAVVMDPENWVRGFLGAPVLREPGTHFVYNTGATFVLSAILQKTTGQKLVDYLEPRLFAPLGIKNAVWYESPQGINVGGWGLNITTEDIARFGQMYLQKGMWNGQQLVPEVWVAEATVKQIPNPDGGTVDWQQGYGYQFWRCQHGAYRGDGAFGQYCIVMQEQDAVLVITGGMPDMQVPLNLVWKFLLPALGTEALPEDSAAQAQLADKLASLHFPTVEGAATSPTAAGVSGRTYQLEDNELCLESIQFQIGEAGGSITITSPKGEETLEYGYGEWQFGRTPLFNDLEIRVPHRTAISGAWTADDTFTLLIRLHETPFYHTFVCRFSESGVNIETWNNVSFVGSRRLQLIGKLAR